jgi:hypothetical protein
MKRAALLILAACTLDPQGVIDHAVLKVDLYGADGDNAQLRVTDSMAHTVEKKTPVRGDPMEMLFEQNTVAPGSVLIDAELFDDGGTLIGCSTRMGMAGEMADPVLVAFRSPSEDQLNCGTCGNRCEADNASASCVMGLCQFTCNSGFVPGDGGCVMPMVMMDGGVPDAGMEDGGVMDGGTCVPSPENTVVTCSDHIDNNCDMRIDCADPGCNGITRLCTTSCNTQGIQSWDCTTGVWGACTGDPGAEGTPATCSDGIDNDCDGKTDCADPKCQNVQVACNGGVDICAAGVKLWNCSTHLLGLCLPYVPLPEAPLLCGDGLDNDCNGKTDCDDSACAGKSCGLGKVCCPDHTCRSGC